MYFDVFLHSTLCIEVDSNTTGLRCLTIAPGRLREDLRFDHLVTWTRWYGFGGMVLGGIANQPDTLQKISNNDKFFAGERRYSH